ncbi:rab GTPase-binding effector protein 1 isoform X2 [Prorops nasuta]|uniref:rab GTPase-binding effector protein 1 isoform X2 n=1 Tax=Prorops nasuta TaxID=863751 RepID=UPI0034CD1F77
MENHTQDSSTIDDIDDDLQAKVNQLEAKNTRMLEEFNVQRAKMKELFLQKENELSKKKEDNVCLREANTKLQKELDELRSQLVIQNEILLEKRKAQEEIASLQQVIHETVEESSFSKIQLDAELNKLRMAASKLHEENVALKTQLERDSPVEGPQISLSTVTKTLARKVVSQLGADSLTMGPDHLEESMRKAQEDAEVLRSLVVPLEEEIKALKEKLRSMDDELQKYKENQIQRRQQEGSSEPICDMCVNYEAQLVRMQANAKDLEKQLADSEHMLEVQKEDLTKEVEFRKEMEMKWNEKKEEYKQKVVELTAASQKAQQNLNDLKRTFEQSRREIVDQLSKLAERREEVQRRLIELQRENENLVGKHSKHSQQLQNEQWNLPNNVEELHLILLRMHEDLIVAKVAQEVSQDKEATLRSEVALLREEMDKENVAKEQLISKLTNEVSQLKIQLEKNMTDRRVLGEAREKIQELEQQLEETLKRKRELESLQIELRQKVTNLQHDLDVSETVQKDFVKLSQTLQVQLEKIRQVDSEVRWQYEDDVEKCSGCLATFIDRKKKEHCRHCGHIFCPNCLSHVVNSGPKQRPSKVCGVCHTLLVRESAPYFSQKAPQIAD